MPSTTALQARETSLVSGIHGSSPKASGHRIDHAPGGERGIDGNHLAQVPTVLCLLAGRTAPEKLLLHAELDERNCEVKHADGSLLPMTLVTGNAAGTPLYVQRGHWHVGSQPGSSAQWLVPHAADCQSLELSSVLSRLPAPAERLNGGGPFGLAGLIGWSQGAGSLAGLSDTKLIEALIDEKLPIDDAFKELRGLSDRHQRRLCLHHGGLIDGLSRKLEQKLEASAKEPEKLCEEVLAQLRDQGAYFRACIIAVPAVAARLAQGIAAMSPRKACEALQQLPLKDLHPLFLAEGKVLQKWAGFRADPSPTSEHVEDPAQAIVVSKIDTKGSVSAAYQPQALAMMAVALQRAARGQAEAALQLLDRVRRAKVVDFGPVQEKAYHILADHLNWYHQPLAGAIDPAIFAGDSGLSHGFLLKAVEKYQMEVLPWLDQHPDDQAIRRSHQDWEKVLCRGDLRLLARAISVSPPRHGFSLLLMAQAQGNSKLFHQFDMLVWLGLAGSSSRDGKRQTVAPEDAADALSRALLAFDAARPWPISGYAHKAADRLAAKLKPGSVATLETLDRALLRLAREFKWRGLQDSLSLKVLELFEQFVPRMLEPDQLMWILRERPIPQLGKQRLRRLEIKVTERSLENGLDAWARRQPPLEVKYDDRGLYIPRPSDVRHVILNRMRDAGSGARALRANCGDLIMRHAYVSTFPSAMALLQRLTELDPTRYKPITRLDLSFGVLTNLDDTIAQFTALKTLLLSDNKLHEIDLRRLDTLIELETLDLSNNRLTALPDFSHLPKLRSVDVSGNPLSTQQLEKLQAWCAARDIKLRSDLRALLLKDWEDGLPASCRATKERRETIERIKFLFENALKEIERDDWSGFLSCAPLKPEGRLSTDLLPWKCILAMPGLKELHLRNHCNDRLPIELAAVPSLERIRCHSGRALDTVGVDLIDSVIALCEKSGSIREVDLGGAFLRREDLAKIEQFNAAHDGPPRPWGDKSWLQTAQQREVYDAANIGAARRIQIVADAKWGRSENHSGYNDSATLTDDAFHHVCERMLNDQVHNGGAVRMVALALDAPPGQFAPWPQIIAFRAQVQQACEDAGLPEAAGPNHDHGWGSHCMIVLRGADKAETIDTTNKIMQNLERNMQQNLPEAAFTAAFGNASMSANYVVPDSLSLKDLMKSTRINLLQGVEARLAKAQADKALLNAT